MSRVLLVVRCHAVEEVSPGALVLRPAKRRVEQVFRLLMGEVSAGWWVRFAEMDVTDLKADGAFFDRMIEWGVFEAEEVREVVDALLR